MSSTGTTRRLVRRVVSASAALVAVVALVVPATPAAALPASEVQKQQWWISRLGLQDAWKITKGAGTTVAVVDSGVASSFGDLKGALVNGFLVDGSAGNGQTDVDNDMHGTRVADFIAGRGTGFGQLGVAPQTKILPVQIGSGDGGTPEQTAQALTKLAALADPPDVVNMSYGQPEDCSPQLQQAVQAAVAKGMVLVASAGNGGTEGNPTNTPANCVGVVAVGAYGDDLQPWANSTRQSFVSLAGPGVKMIGYDANAASGYGYSFGTSDAAAIVSGGFALLKAHFPTATPRELVTKMLYTARQFQGAQGTRNDTWGYGAARPRHALTDTVPATAANPLFDALEKLSASPSAAPSSSAAASSPAATATGSSATPAAAPADDSSSNGLLIGIIVAVVVIALLVVLLVVRSRRRPARAPGSGP